MLCSSACKAPGRKHFICNFTKSHKPLVGEIRIPKYVHGHYELSVSDSICFLVWPYNIVIYDVIETGRQFITVFLKLKKRFRAGRLFPSPDFIQILFYSDNPTIITWELWSPRRVAIDVYVKKSSYKKMKIPFPWKDHPKLFHFIDSRFNRILFAHKFGHRGFVFSELHLGCDFELGQTKPTYKVNIYDFNFRKDLLPVMYFNEKFGKLVLGTQYKNMFRNPHVCATRTVFSS